MQNSYLPSTKILFFLLQKPSTKNWRNDESTTVYKVELGSESD